MNTLLFFWVLFALTMLFVELASPGLLYCAPFTFGALSAVGMYWCGFHVIAQLIVFLVVSLSLLVVLHKLVVRSTANNSYVSNVHALIGKRALVVSVIQLCKPGAVKIDGERWPARTELDQPIPIGTIVSVIQISGCHVIVVPINKEL